MRRSILAIYLLIMTSSLAMSAGGARLLSPVGLHQVSPQGWLLTMMQQQEQNFTGKLDSIGFPFDCGGWGGKPFLRTKNGVTAGFWVPYEQTAYYYDGMMRLGLLLDSQRLLGKSRKAIYNTIAQASPEGMILPILSTSDMRRWPHAVFFRAMMAEYEATANPTIIEALRKHYASDTTKYEGRDLCNFETLAWLYRQTGENFFKHKALAMLDAPCVEGKTLQETIEQFASAERTEIHAVTFYELLKIPALAYELTGNSQYLKLADAAFEKIDRYNMLPDGVPSGEEGLSDRTSRNVHEMCNVIDYMWTCTYMLRATRNPRYADRIERALFNAGIGGITKRFDAHQYYSAVNQVVCSDHSSHVSTYDASRMAFRQIHRPPCCTGNLNRMFPVYAGNEWMTSENEVYKMLYGAGSVELPQGVTLSEESAYPFGDRVVIKVTKGAAMFSLHLRIPEWCSGNAVATVNGNGIQQIRERNGFWIITRYFREGDVVELTFPKKAQYVRWDADAMIMEYGPLLMALPIENKMIEQDILTPKLQNYPYKGYSINATGDWNYILGVKDASDCNFKVEEMAVTMADNPWAMPESPVKISVPAYKYDAWKLEYRRHHLPSGDEIMVPVTPSLPARGAMIYALNGLTPQAVVLEPYGRTVLRMAMFPFWRVNDIPAEVLATD